MRSKEQTHNSDNAVSKQRLPQSTTQSLGTLARQQTHPATLVQRAQLDPRSLTPGDVLQLQRTIGNQAVGRLLAGTKDHPVPPIQATLTIGQPGDKYEQEADRVAPQVVKQINAPASAPSTLGQSVQRQEGPGAELQAKPEITALQRQEEPDEELQAKPRISDLQRSPLPPEVQLEAMPEEEDLQAKSIRRRREAIAGGEASADLASAINSARGGGQPLDAGLQRSMGLAMGADFSGVRVHTDAQSDQLNQSIQAKAFTTGQDVFFRQGGYNPVSCGGQELIAHELTHVVQQNGGEVQRSPQAQEQLQQHPATETLSASEGDHHTIQRKIIARIRTQPTRAGYREISEVRLEGRAPTDTPGSEQGDHTVAETLINESVRSEVINQQPLVALINLNVLARLTLEGQGVDDKYNALIGEISRAVNNIQEFSNLPGEDQNAFLEDRIQQYIEAANKRPGTAFLRRQQETRGGGGERGAIGIVRGFAEMLNNPENITGEEINQLGQAITALIDIKYDINNEDRYISIIQRAMRHAVLSVLPQLGKSWVANILMAVVLQLKERDTIPDHRINEIFDAVAHGLYL